jgi:hypothetical protein
LLSCWIDWFFKQHDSLAYLGGGDSCLSRQDGPALFFGLHLLALGKAAMITRSDFCVLTPTGGSLSQDASAKYLDLCKASVAEQELHHVHVSDMNCPMKGRVVGYQSHPHFRFYIWLDSDDALLPGATEALVRAANQNPNAIMLHGGYCNAGNQPTVMPFSKSLLACGQCPSPVYCLSQEFMERVANSSFPEGRFGLNYWVYSRLLNESELVVTVPDALIRITRHAESRSRKNLGGMARDLCLWRQDYHKAQKP